MIDIVIPLRNDSKWDNNEIRYCLRSVEKHLTGIRDVYIIGHKPKFLQNVKHVPMRDTSQWATVNIRKKLLAACDNPEVSENFLYMNDDHYLLEDYKKDVFYHQGPLIGTHNRSKNSIYRKIILNTMEVVGQYHNDFDIHTPVLINKHVFQKSMNQVSWDFNPNEWNEKWGGYLIKTTYIHSLFRDYPQFHSREAEDGKVRDPKADWADIAYLSQFTPVISSSDIVGKGMVKFLERMFPEKSKYEI